jgi:hypothetical protein
LAAPSRTGPAGPISSNDPRIRSVGATVSIQ